MRQINYGVTLSLLLVITLLISGCSSFYKPEKEVVIQTELVEKNIPIVPRPRPVQLNEIKIYVVSPEENFEEFKKEFEAKKFVSYKDQFQAFLFAGFILILLELFLFETKTKWVQRLNLFNEK